MAMGRDGYGAYSRRAKFFVTLAPELISARVVDHTIIEISKQRANEQSLVEDFRFSRMARFEELPRFSFDETTSKPQRLSVVARWEDNEHHVDVKGAS